MKIAFIHAVMIHHRDPAAPGSCECWQHGRPQPTSTDNQNMGIQKTFLVGLTLREEADLPRIPVHRTYARVAATHSRQRATGSSAIWISVTTAALSAPAKRPREALGRQAPMATSGV